MRKWWMVVVVVVAMVCLLLLGIWFGMRGRRPARENLLVPEQFNCGDSKKYIDRLAKENPDLFKKLANYLVKNYTKQSQSLIGMICSKLNANKSFAEINDTIEKAMQNADMMKPPTTPDAAAIPPAKVSKAAAANTKAEATVAAAAAAKTKAEVTTAVARQTVQDYIQTSNVQCCDKTSLETYLKSNPDKNTQVQSLYDTWVNFAGSSATATQPTDSNNRLNSMLQEICTASNPDPNCRTNSAMYNSYAGWLLSQPPELGRSTSMSLSCNPMVLGPHMDTLPTDQQAAMYGFLDKVVDQKVPNKEQTYDKRASVLSWLCSIAQSKPADFETAVDKLVLQDPNTFDLTAITKTLFGETHGYRIIENENLPRGENATVYTEEQRNQILADPPNFDTWIWMNPKSQALFSYYLPCHQEVGKYMNETELSKKIYSRLNRYLNASEQVSFFKKLCNIDQNGKLKVQTKEKNDEMLKDYEKKFKSYYNKSSVKDGIFQYWETYDKVDKVAFIDDVYTNKLKRGSSTTDTDAYVETKYLNKTEPKKETPAEFQITQPKSISHTPAINNLKTYVKKGYLVKDLNIPVRVDEFTYYPGLSRADSVYYNSYASMFYDGAVMSDPDQGINDMRVQSAFRQYFTDAMYVYTNIFMRPSVKEASYQGFPYYVLFASDDKGVCKYVTALGITGYSELMSTQKLVQQEKVMRDGVYQSVWILDDVDRAIQEEK